MGAKRHRLRAVWLFVKFLLVASIAVVGASFAMKNGNIISVDFVFVSGPSLSIGMWLLLFLASGVFLGMLASSTLLWSYRRKIRLRDKKD